jgi:hypothetical protein
MNGEKQESESRRKENQKNMVSAFSFWILDSALRHCPKCQQSGPKKGGDYPLSETLIFPTPYFLS